MDSWQRLIQFLKRRPLCKKRAIEVDTACKTETFIIMHSQVCNGSSCKINCL